MTDAEIIREVRLKSKAGAAGLYDKYAVALMIVIIRIVQNKSAAEDLLCESFYEIWQRLDLYNEKDGMLFTFMKNVAVTLAQKYKNQNSKSDKIY